jgi:hypothetical protein
MVDVTQYEKLFTTLLQDSSARGVQAFGEVYTPLVLVNDMLDRLPSHVWSDPTLKWFEPACGLAPFMFVAYQRLMIGLEATLPDSELRKRHILEHMLHFNELQPKNLLHVRKLFQVDQYRLNIFEGDMFTDLPVSFTADIVIGNPPYNKIGTKNSGNAEWMKFVSTILTTPVLRTGGYLSFVHPAPWRKPESERSKNRGLFQLMTSTNQMLYLSMHDVKEGKKMFNCGTNYDWYIIQKHPRHTTTQVQDIHHNIHELDLSLWPWLPNFAFEQIFPLLAQGEEPRCPVLYSCSDYETRKAWISDTKSEKFCYPVVRTIPNAGMRLMYSSTNSKGMFGVGKVIFGDSSLQSPILDVTGEYATGENAMSIRIASEAEGIELCQALASDRIQDILRKACLFSNYRLDWRVLAGFKAGFWRV